MTLREKIEARTRRAYAVAGYDSDDTYPEQKVRHAIRNDIRLIVATLNELLPDIVNFVTEKARETWGDSIGNAAGFTQAEILELLKAELEGV